MRRARISSDNELPGVRVSRVALSIGVLDLVEFAGYEHAFPRHSHEEFTVGVFASGNGSLGYRAASWSAFDGGVLAVSPGEVHTAEPLRESGWTYRAIYPGPAFMAAALGDSSDRPASVHFRKPVHRDRELASSLTRVHRHLSAGRPTLEIETLILGALRQLAHRHGVTAIRPDDAMPSSHVVECAREYLAQHLCEPISLGSLATACGSSPFHLVRMFSAHVGMPPHAYLTQLRVARARDLLRGGSPGSAVAYQCGFCDQAHLTRTFKKFYGVTPGAYLRALGGNAGRRYSG